MSRAGIIPPQTEARMATLRGYWYRSVFDLAKKSGHYPTPRVCLLPTVAYISDPFSSNTLELMP